ncbi:hypothetical protein [Ancylobacter sp. IITR112]|uniref:hypothetical protein n=1 Tax=Ancylobacter sp. IITR112 TaxID=3138073 RepID=UPI00352A0265
MEAIVSFPWFSRAAPTATSMAVDRPEAIDPHPKGRNEMEGGRGWLFCLAMQSRLAGGGKKPDAGVAGIRARRA